MHTQLHNDDIYIGYSLMHIFRGLPISAFLCRISNDQNLPDSWGRTIGDESGILLNGNMHIYIYMELTSGFSGKNLYMHAI